MAITAADARDYLLLACQCTPGNQALDHVSPEHRLTTRAIVELSDAEAKRVAKGVRAWLQETYPSLFKPT